MNLKITTYLPNQEHKAVFNRFDKDLFNELAPLFPPMKVVRFDGSKVGDVVHVKLWALLGWQQWVSEITERVEGDQVSYFVDEGTRLPVGLKYWRHQHWVKQEGESVAIIDDITFKGSFFLLDWIMYPLLYWQFVMRRPKYKRYFSGS